MKKDLLSEYKGAVTRVRELSVTIRKETGWTPLQCLVIDALSGQEKVLQSALVKTLHTDRSTLSELLSRLHEAKLVRKYRGRDKRENRFALSARGVAAAAEIYQKLHPEE